MKYVIQFLLVISLSVLSACDRGQDTDQSPVPVATDTTPDNTRDTPALQESVEAPSLQAGEYQVVLSDNAVIIRANQVNELVLFKAVAEEGGFKLLAEPTEWKTVNTDIHTDTLHDAVVALISGYPHEIVYAPTSPGDQETLSEVVIGDPVRVTEEKADKEDRDARKKNREKKLDPGQEALLYIKQYDRLGQQMAYLEKLQDPTPEIREAAAKEIMPTSDNLPIMAELLINDPSPDVRIAATWSLEISNDADAPQAIAALVKCLDDPDTRVVAECIDSLGFIGDETTVEYLSPFITHENEEVRRAALEAIRFLQ